MPGRPDFSQPGTDGGGQTVAMQSRPEIVNIDESTTDSVASGTVERIDIYAPTGSVWNLLGAYMTAPDPSSSGATTGDHTILCETAGQVRFLRGVSEYNERVSFDNGHWKRANKTEEPDSAGGQQTAIQAARADENKPLTIKYLNDTDSSQDGERKRRFTFEEVSY